MKILRRTSSSEPAPEPAARRRVEITVEREAVVGGLPPSFEAYCTGCGRQVVMLNPSSAALVAQVSVRSIYRWVDESRLHFIESPAGDLYLCAVSLQAQPETQNPQEPLPASMKTLPSGDPR